MENQNSIEMYTNTISPEVTPDNGEGYSWSYAISLIAWGLLFNALTIDFWLLQYILPTIGVVYLYFGFRELRKCNAWFHVAWIFSGIILIEHFIFFIINATPLNALADNSIVLGIIGTVFQLVLLFTFRNGIQKVFQKAQKKPIRDPILGLICWTILLSIGSLTGIFERYGLIIFVPVIIFLLAMIHSLFKMIDDLDSLPDSLIVASTKVGNRVFAGGYYIICILCVLICCLFANHTFLDEEKQVEAKETGIQSKLVDLGFPEDIITDISDDDIALLSDAYHVEYDCKSMSFGDIDMPDQSTIKYQYNSNADVMQSTTIYIVSPDNYLYIIVYFDWKDNHAYWQDGFTIGRSDSFKLLNGVLLFSRKGINYTAPIPRLKYEEVTINDMVGSRESGDISGTISYPFNSKNQRGYVFYRVQLPSTSYNSGNWFNYIHNKNPFQFPYMQIEDSFQNIFNKNKEQHYTIFQYEFGGNQ